MKDINQYVLIAKNDDQKKEGLVQQYRPFIISNAKKAAGRYIDDRNDDEYAIALEAFIEAIDKYDVKRGAFLSFAALVIKSRITDYYRKTHKVLENETLDEHIDPQGNTFHMSDRQSLDEFKQHQEHLDLVGEIDHLSKQLQSWEITFDELVDCSPKHSKTRKICAKIAETINSDPLCQEHVFKVKRLPANHIEKKLGLPAKKYERFRKYIIALIVIKNGEYNYLSEYMKLSGD